MQNIRLCDYSVTVKYLLHSCGLLSIWDELTPIGLKLDLSNLKQKLKHIFLSLYNQSNRKIPAFMTEYNDISNIKISPQKYLHFNIPSYMKKCITRLRLQSNRLELVRGRYTRPKVPPDQRLCSSCNAIDDEEHLITKCGVVADIRENTFKTMSENNQEFSNLSDSEKPHFFLHPPSYDSTLIIGHFITKIFKERNL